MRSVVKFDSKGQEAFYSTLRTRVHEKLYENGGSTKGGAHMVIKSIVLLGAHFSLYGLMISGIFEPYWAYLLMYVGLGVGMAVLGLAVGHDANHGSFSNNDKVNEIMGWVMDLIGGSSPNWRMQHNILHHTYTNIQGHDEDINSTDWLLRFSPHVKRGPLHRFQWIYAWLLYGLLTVSWLTLKDFKQLTHFHKIGLLKSQKMSYAYAMTRVILWKALVYGYLVVLPTILLPFSLGQILLCLLVMLFTSGLILSSIFQPAHVIGDCDFPLPNDKGTVENDFAIHQLQTTSNFAPKSNFFHWIIGGLNHQVEHHLFPRISHVHYRKIAPIVKQTAEEFGLPYYSQPTFMHAVIAHTKLLKEFGKAA